ncbi:BA75_04294T0 [Komagataella pastoris]|uniref:BA75_04294T0 n=1 Tax=Komagataella pastoris TaxID=4922 RepID=A0A1B2JHC8_PICPA|nr:BA75_04294T0 [Komagataella pastoris]
MSSFEETFEGDDDSFVSLTSQALALPNSSAPRRGSIILSNGPSLTYRTFPKRMSLEESDGDAMSQVNYGSILEGTEGRSFSSRRPSLSSIRGQSLRYAMSHGTFHESSTSYVTEIKMLIKFSIPLVVTFLLQYSLTVSSVFSVGHLGELPLAAVSLASMTANVTAYSIIQGIATCLDTLCPQAFGRNDHRMVGVHFLRCTTFLLLLYIPIFCLWFWGAEPILLKIVPNPELSGLASQYLRVLAFGLPGFILFENCKHFLQAQGIFHASTYVLLFCAPLNMLLNYLLVWDKKIGLGYIGAPVAVVFTNWLMAAMLIVYIARVKGHECWCGFSKEAFKNWKRMLDLAGPGVLMVEAEWLAFEIITFFASRFGPTVLASQTVVSTTCVLMYQIPFAVSIAASTRVAWFIGSGSKHAAILAVKVSMLVGLVVGLSNAAFLFTFRHTIASLFSSDSEVIELASKVLVVGSVYQVNDFISCIASGVLRGQGRQKIGGFLNLFSYYVVALPIAWYCGFHLGMQLLGLWYGMVIALILVSTSETFFIWLSDWDGIIQQSIDDAIHDNCSLFGNPLSRIVSSISHA